MVFQPDVMVFAPDTPKLMLVGVVRSSLAEIDKRLEAELKDYMLGMRCPLGLLVAPEGTRVYHETYADYTPESIAFVGEFATAELLRLEEVPRDERRLARAVRSWLKQVATGSLVPLPATPEIRQPLTEHLVPLVVEGRVMSGAPRNV